MTDASQGGIRLQRARPGRVGPAIAKVALLAFALAPVAWLATIRASSPTALTLWDLGWLVLLLPAAAIYALLAFIALHPEHHVYELTADPGGLHLRYLATVLPLLPGRYHSIEVAWHQVSRIELFKIEDENDPSDCQWELHLFLAGSHPGYLRVFTMPTDHPRDCGHATDLCERLHALRDRALGARGPLLKVD